MKRIAYIDCLRGISMLMVVYCHVEQFSFGFKDFEFIGDVCNIVMLPLFFFVSGLFTSLSLASSAIIKRIRYVVIPTIVMFLIYISVWGDNLQIANYIGSEYKFGYWFTIA